MAQGLIHDALCVLQGFAIGLKHPCTVALVLIHVVVIVVDEDLVGRSGGGCRLAGAVVIHDRLLPGVDWSTGNLELLQDWELRRVHSEYQFHLPFVEDHSIEGVPGGDLNPALSAEALDAALVRLADDPRSIPTLAEILRNSVSLVVIYEGVQQSTELLRLVETLMADAR